MGNKEDKKKVKELLLIQKHKEAKISRKIVFIITTISVLLFVGIITGVFLYVKSALEPVEPDSREKITVDIPMGSGSSTIARILEENEIIKDATVFKYYLKFKNESDLQAGPKTLSKSMTLDEIIEVLKTGKLINTELTIALPEGIHIKEISAIIAEKTGYREEEILNTLNSETFVNKVMEKYPQLITEEVFHEDVKYPLEGYLFPATYDYPKKKPSIEEVVMPMIDKTEEVVSFYQTDITKKDMTVHEVLTMASLIEEEASEEAERKNISSVFYNRLDEGMPLQTDPTVIYALGEHRSRLTYKDYYETIDPYNTYVIDALPPGPIANAGKLSIEAALYPTTTDYYYFLATPEGEVLFSQTLDEHNEKYEQHIKGRN